MIDPIFSDEKNNQEIPLDFETLRTHGIEHIQEIAGEVWTDFNLHDPGVTILEQLCFALTDLAYQTQFDIADQLADKKGIINYPANSFFSKQEILTSNPVTINDYRKAIIDEVDEIDNVWIEPLTDEYNSDALKGLYKITVQANEKSAKTLSDNEIDDSLKEDQKEQAKKQKEKNKEDLKEKIIENVRKSFCSKRNLCEDIFGDIILLEPVQITIHADILIEPNLVAEQIMARIYIALEKTINKRVRYSTKNEMLQTGLAMDQVYSGPLLKNGFLPDSELSERPYDIEAANIIQSLSVVEGVVLVKSLYISKTGSNDLRKIFTSAKSEIAFIDITKDAAEQNINLFIDRYRLPPVRKGLFFELLQKALETRYTTTDPSQNIDPNLKGVYRDTTQYYSIQNYFPLVYGIGEEGLLGSVSKERKAQARQLKAYLMLFEQVLTNYLAQLDHLVAFFSNEVDGDDPQTYFTNPLYSVPGADDIIKAHMDDVLLKQKEEWEELKKNKVKQDGLLVNPNEEWEKFKKDKKNQYVQALNTIIESDTVFDGRKNRILDHLMARFNELSIIYPVRLYNRIYSIEAVTGRITREISWKASVLRDLGDINYNRIRGFDYLNSKDKRYNFEEKIRKFLHITNDNRESLTAVFDKSKLNFDKIPDSRQEQDRALPKSDGSQADWNQELQKIALNKEEISQLIEQQLLSGAESEHNDSFVFMNQDASVFKNAVNINNFRVGPDPYQDGDYLILYKAPADERWNIISRHKNNQAPAITMLKKLVEYLTQISIRSEGFYLVEHILLRPPADSKSYGFKFYKNDSQVVFENSGPLTFTERTEIISRLFKFAPGEDFYRARQNMDLFPQIKNLRLTAENMDDISDKAAQLLKQATYLYTIATELADKAVKNSPRLMPDGSKSPERIIAEENKTIAGQNKGFADKNLRIINQFLQSAEKIDAAGPGTTLHWKRDGTINAELQKALKTYTEYIEELFKKADEHENRTRSQSETINETLLNQLAGLGKKTFRSGDTYTDVLEIINSIKSQGDGFGSRLKMTVTDGEGTMVSESFFNATMTIVFPDWPARFQDVNFRACAEGMFRLNAPAHIKTRVKWLSKKQIETFEPIYTAWKKRLAGDKIDDVSWGLVSFLSDRANNYYHKFKS